MCSYPLIDAADFESVVLVRSDHQNGVAGLKGLNYCHPGLYYDRNERWSERFLKHFERSVTSTECTNSSAAEIEIQAISKHFNLACRPGSWSNNPEEDSQLSKFDKKM